MNTLNNLLKKEIYDMMNPRSRAVFRTTSSSSRNSLNRYIQSRHEKSVYNKWRNKYLKKKELHQRILAKRNEMKVYFDNDELSTFYDIHVNNNHLVRRNPNYFRIPNNMRYRSSNSYLTGISPNILAIQNKDHLIIFYKNNASVYLKTNYESNNNNYNVDKITYINRNSNELKSFVLVDYIRYEEAQTYRELLDRFRNLHNDNSGMYGSVFTNIFN